MTASRQRTLGVTVLTDFLLNEGVEQVLDNLFHRCHATAVAINPTVTVKCEEGEGSFQPPLDGGTSPRLFDRPLWGQRALWVKSAPSFKPRGHLYEDIKYGPRSTSSLTDEFGSVVRTFIQTALDRGLEVYMQLGAAQPTGLKDADRPLLPNGKLPDRMADTASLASPAVREYNRAYLKDLFLEYPDLTGIRIDWPEYPCYKFEEIFQDFGPHAEDFARHHGFDFDHIQKQVGTLHEFLQGNLTSEMLHPLLGTQRSASFLVEMFISFPYLAEWLRLKRMLSADLIRHWHECLIDAGGSDKRLCTHAFMPPYTLLTGFSFAAAAEHAHSISPKLYTMHWPQMVTFWGERLLTRNPELNESLLVQALVSLMDLADASQDWSLADFHYPEPDEAHPIADGPQARKLQAVIDQVAGKVPVWPLVHGYGPADDFERRFKVVANSSVDGVWLNRYGYLSDEKLDIVGRNWG